MLHEGQPREYRFNIINLREMGAHWISDGITKIELMMYFLEMFSLSSNDCL